jgi:hypothetical protein
MAAQPGLARSTATRRPWHEVLGRLVRIDPPELARRCLRECPGEVIHPDFGELAGSIGSSAELLPDPWTDFRLS